MGLVSSYTLSHGTGRAALLVTTYYDAGNSAE